MSSENNRNRDSSVRRVLEASSTSSSNITTNTSISQEESQSTTKTVELLVQEIGLEVVLGFVTLQRIIQEDGLDTLRGIVNQIRKDRDGTGSSQAASGGAAAAPPSATQSSTCPTPITQTSPVAFVEKDFVVKQEPEEEEEEERESRKHVKHAPPESEEEGGREGRTSTGSHKEQQPITNHDNDDDNDNDNDNDNNNSSHRVIVKSEDSLADEGTSNNEKRKQGSVMSEEDLIINNNKDDAYSTQRNRRGKRKQCPSEEEEDDSNYPHDSLQVQKKKKNNNKKKTTKNNRHDRELAALATSINSPEQTIRNNQRREEEDDEDEIDTTSTIVDPDSDDDDDSNYDETDSSIDNNYCRLCNDPDWEGKIYYKCGTIISKYFPKSDNNPNPGWYEGTIRMHHHHPPSSDDYDCSYRNEHGEEEKANSSGGEEEESHHQRQSIIVFNEIHYEDGDKENITQNDLKLQLREGHKVKMMQSTKKTTTSKRGRCNHADDVRPPPTWSDSEYDLIWLEKYNKLQRFNEENGHCRVPRSYSPDPSLGVWVNTQRQRHKMGKLAPRRAEKLNKIGFEWVLLERSIQTWDEMLCRLEQFKDENGHCRVPRTYGPDPQLANWVSNQRQDYKKGNMAPDRVQKLKEIGLQWAIITETHDQSWQEAFYRLKEFKRKNGNCQVPYRYNPDPQLANWVSKQRNTHKKGKLAPDRVDKLNKIGFEWALRGF